MTVSSVTSPSLISVVLATRGRDDSLRVCLESLAQSRLPEGWLAEVIAVDNGCSEATRAVVDAFAMRGNIVCFRYLCESRRGKGYAVNHGVSTARGRLFAFTDDDIVVDPGWLAEIIDAFESDPGLGLVTGRVLPASTKGKPVAVTMSREATSLNESSSLSGLVLGCNLAVRPDVLKKVRGRDTRIGPGRGLSCEDIDFTHRVLRSGFRGVFLPAPTVYHEPGERDRRREYLRGWGAFYLKFVLSGDRKVARQAWWHLRAIAKEFRAGEWSSAFNQAWNLLVGAGIMVTRLTLIRKPYG